MDVIRTRMGLVAVALVVLASGLFAIAGPGAAHAEEPTPQFTPVKRYNVLRRLVFPVIGVTKYWSGFGDCRDHCRREHHGVDILTYGYKGLPVVAAHDGTVVKVTYDEGNAGCSVRIRDKYRWETRYFHLNNDFPGTDTVGAPCPAPGIVEGAEVVAGQIIGYIGDSGNSEDTVPHLHFELRSRTGYPIDPYRSLKASRKITYELLPPDLSDTSVAISSSTYRPGERTVVVVSSQDAHRLGSIAGEPFTVEGPIIVVDRDAPEPALAELDRLDAARVIVFRDADETWLEDIVRSRQEMVHTSNFGEAPDPAPAYSPDTGLIDEVPQPADRFATLVVGRTDRIYYKYRDAFAQFVADHHAIVMQADRNGPKSIGERSWSFPGKDAAEDVLWWHTGNGWQATSSLDDVPEVGFAYVTDRRALPWTLAFLADLAELPAMPVWRSS